MSAKYRLWLPVVSACTLLVAFAVFQTTWKPSTQPIFRVSGQEFSYGTIKRGAFEFGIGNSTNERPHALLLSAACWTYEAYIDDSIVGPDFNVVQDAGLLRSAELLDGAYAREPVAFEAEDLLMKRGNTSAVIEAFRGEGVPAASLEIAAQYLRERAEPPSPNAATVYVIVQAQMTGQTVITIRLKPSMPRRLISRPGSTIGDFTVHVDGGRTFHVNESACWK